MAIPPSSNKPLGHNWLAEILVPERIQCGISLSSMKKAHEHIAELFAHTTPALPAKVVFDALRARERLGNTGLGHGIALPHCRLPHLSAPLGALLILKEGIPYDSPDNEPVDILFALLVPEEAREEHLHILSEIAQRFGDPTFLKTLRSAHQVDVIFNELFKI